MKERTGIITHTLWSLMGSITLTVRYKIILTEDYQPKAVDLSVESDEEHPELTEEQMEEITRAVIEDSLKQPKRETKKTNYGMGDYDFSLN